MSVPPPRRRRTAAEQKAIIEGVGALVTLVIVAVIAIWVFTAHAPSQKEFYGTSDGSGALACDNFRGVARDAKNGVSTLPEIRDGLKNVWSDAQVSTTPEIRNNARTMLADATAGDYTSPDFKAAIIDMDKACTAIGH